MDLKYIQFKNSYMGHIPDYWKIPLSKYTNEVCFVTADSVVAAPKLLLRTIFPKFDSLLCQSCSEGHDRVTIIIKEIGSDLIQDAFKMLASGDSRPLADILELQLEEVDNTEDIYAVNEVDNDAHIKEDPLLEDQDQEEEDGEVQVKSEAVFPKEEMQTNALLACESCDFVASNEANLEAHMDECNLIVLMPEANNDSNEVQSGDKSQLKTVSCNDCEFSAEDNVKLIEHIAKNHYKEYDCEVDGCNYAGKSEKKLKAHMKKEHVKLQMCKFCFFTSKFLGTVRRHQKEVHPEKKRFNCNSCEFTTGRKIEFIQHKRAHISPNCNYCAKRFKYSASLENHVKQKHHFKCLTCGEIFSSRMKRTNHTRAIHETRVMQKCKFCNLEQKKIESHEKNCLFKNKNHFRSALFQDRSFGWI